VYGYSRSEDYVGFVVVGGAMIAFWMNVLWGMSSQLYWEKEQGNLALYIMTPSSMMAILLGMALGGLFSTSLRALLIILLGSLFFNVHYACQHAHCSCIHPGDGTLYGLG
jgi:ABC-2 type transport system permease protein